jgi:hypothetical protein
MSSFKGTAPRLHDFSPFYAIREWYLSCRLGIGQRRGVVIMRRNTIAELALGVCVRPGRIDPVADAVLGFFDRTEPLVGVGGGGVMLQGEPLLVDFGYRCKKVMAGDSLQ